ncbi:MAG TPA: hypothetical protein VGI04_01825 [Neobacillus sp.]
MNMFALLIPILFVVGMVYFGAKLMNKTVNRNGNYSYGNRVLRIFVGYLAILLLCVVLDMVLPAKGMPDWKVVRTIELEKESEDLYYAALEGRIDKVDHKFIVKKWSFDYHNQQLNIEVPNNEALNIQVMIEKKKTNDDKIEAVFYRTRSSMNDKDISGIAKPISLELNKDLLTLLPPQRGAVKFTEFTNAFPVKQFTGEKKFFDSTNFFDGQSILYLRIPKDLQLVDQSNLNIEFVE